MDGGQMDRRTDRDRPAEQQMNRWTDRITEQYTDRWTD